MTASRRLHEIRFAAYERAYFTSSLYRTDNRKAWLSNARQDRREYSAHGMRCGFPFLTHRLAACFKCCQTPKSAQRTDTIQCIACIPCYAARLQLAQDTVLVSRRQQQHMRHYDRAWLRSCLLSPCWRCVGAGCLTKSHSASDKDHRIQWKPRPTGARNKTLQGKV